MLKTKNVKRVSAVWGRKNRFLTPKPHWKINKVFWVLELKIRKANNTIFSSTLCVQRLLLAEKIYSVSSERVCRRQKSFIARGWWLCNSFLRKYWRNQTSFRWKKLIPSPSIVVFNVQRIKQFEKTFLFRIFILIFFYLLTILFLWIFRKL